MSNITLNFVRENLSKVISSTLIFLIFIFMPIGSLVAQEEHREIIADSFQSQLTRLASESNGVLGISVIDINGNRAFGVNEDLVFPQGSAIKVAILVALYVKQEQGLLDLSQAVSINASDRVDGTGYLRYFGDSISSLALHDLSVLMITTSDNMATNILIDRAGMDNVNTVMKTLGLSKIKLQRHMIRQEQSARGNENLATPKQAADLMVRILTCDLPIGANSCKELRDILAIPHAGPLADGTPSEVRILQKAGSITGVKTSWAAVELDGRPYAIASMGNFGETERFTSEIQKIAELSYGYFSRLAGATEFGTRVPVDMLERVKKD